MAHLDQLPTTTAVAGIAEPHQSTVASIQHSAALNLFSAAEADLMIGRIRALTTTDAAQALPDSPDGTVR